MSSCSSFKQRLAEKGIVMKKLGSGSTGITFSVCDKTPYCEKKERKSVKISRISRHSKKKTQPEIDFEINRELMKLLVYTPHINSVYSQVKCGFYPTLMDNQNDEIYFKYLEWSTKAKLRKGYPITVTTMELGDYDFFDHVSLVTNLKELKELMFQIVYTLAIVQFYLKGFKHGDFKEDNLLVYNRKNEVPGTIKYNILDKTYEINNTTPHVKLIDFDFSATDKILNCRQPSLTEKETKAEYKRLKCNQYSVKDSRYIGLTSNYKPHYDLFFFLNRLTTVHYTPDKNPEFNQFLSQLLPREYQVENLEEGGENIIIDSRLATNNNRILRGIRSPVELLMSDVFDDLIVETSEVKIKPHSLKRKTGKKSKSRKQPTRAQFSITQQHYDSRITLEMAKKRRDLFVV